MSKSNGLESVAGLRRRRTLVFSLFWGKSRVCRHKCARKWHVFARHGGLTISSDKLSRVWVKHRRRRRDYQSMREMFFGRLFLRFSGSFRILGNLSLSFSLSPFSLLSRECVLCSAHRPHLRLSKNRAGEGICTLAKVSGEGERKERFSARSLPLSWMRRNFPRSRREMGGQKKEEMEVSPFTARAPCANTCRSLTEIPICSTRNSTRTIPRYRLSLCRLKLTLRSTSHRKKVEKIARPHEERFLDLSPQFLSLKFARIPSLFFANSPITLAAD